MTTSTAATRRCRQEFANVGPDIDHPADPLVRRRRLGLFALRLRRRHRYRRDIADHPHLLADLRRRLLAYLTAGRYPTGRSHPQNQSPWPGLNRLPPRHPRIAGSSAAMTGKERRDWMPAQTG